MMGEVIDMFGASVRGPRNLREGNVNQDAWARDCGQFGHLIVVCDGVGSRKTPDVGARAACAAVRKAVRLWPGSSSSADPAYLVRLVEILWRIELTPRALSECATTCCFVLREHDGHLLIAGLGDCFAVLRKADGVVTTFGGRGPDSFGDETHALGGSHRIEDWWIAVDPPDAGRIVVVVSDGVGDDLDPGRVDSFVEWLATDIGRLPGAARWRRLCRELREWPVPHHVDDKTIAVLTEKAET